MLFRSPEQTDRFLEQVPDVEKAMVASGIILVKYWLEVGPDEQTRRIKDIMDQGLHEFLEDFVSRNNKLGQEISDGYRFYQ